MTREEWELIGHELSARADGARILAMAYAKSGFDPVAALGFKHVARVYQTEVDVIADRELSDENG